MYFDRPSVMSKMFYISNHIFNFQNRVGRYGTVIYEGDEWEGQVVDQLENGIYVLKFEDGSQVEYDEDEKK